MKNTAALLPPEKRPECSVEPAQGERAVASDSCNSNSPSGSASNDATKSNAPTEESEQLEKKPCLHTIEDGGSNSSGGGRRKRVQWTWTGGISAVLVGSFGAWFAYEVYESASPTQFLPGCQSSSEPPKPAAGQALSPSSTAASTLCPAAAAPTTLQTPPKVAVGFSARANSASDMNVAKAEWRMSQKLKTLALGEKAPLRAVAESRFQTGLPREMQDNLALYFLQLDVDKPNGVRRTDALALATMEERRTSGCSLQVQRCLTPPISFKKRYSRCILPNSLWRLSAAHETAQRLTRERVPSPLSPRATESCSSSRALRISSSAMPVHDSGEALSAFSQEVGELIEALVLHEEAHPEEAAARRQQPQEEQPRGGTDEQQEMQNAGAEAEVTDAPNTQKGDSDVSTPVLLPGENPQERVLRLLKEANERARPTAWTVPRMESFPQPLAPPLPQQQPWKEVQQQESSESTEQLGVEGSRKEAREALELRLEVVKRTLSDLQALGSRQVDFMHSHEGTRTVCSIDEGSWGPIDSFLVNQSLQSEAMLSLSLTNRAHLMPAVASPRNNRVRFEAYWPLRLNACLSCQ
ncbi:hypothetical protein cyc_07886 [Cyclospora cayetanensis]|uniref:Uncharacterized protein n=1 Tax=Cyclospora cayetanensis TaxID=88456 RepID=A0A1D3D2E4_9EIME|nr:hypothetical protein cyc_07886 [Cyclospora cayetanensis]